MKKLIALLLAMIMVCSLATVAFAETVDTTGWVSEAKTDAIQLAKVYNVTGNVDADDLYPTETLKFTVVGKNTNPDNEPKVTVDDLVVEGNANQVIKVNLPVYDTVGVYEYDITENDGTAQGVTYTDAIISIKVLVEYDYKAGKLLSSTVLSTVNSAEKNEDGSLKENEDGKVDTFTNEYKVGTLTVAKQIDGNLASSDQYFKMTVKLTSAGTVENDITVTGGSGTGEFANPTTIAETEWSDTAPYTVTKTIYLRAGETLTFNNIPEGVTYVVEEDGQHFVEDPNGQNPATGYDVDYTNEKGSISSAAACNAVVLNTKETDINTGVALDSAPYIVMLVVAMVGVVALVSKKRYEV